MCSSPRGCLAESILPPGGAPRIRRSGHKRGQNHGSEEESPRAGLSLTPVDQFERPTPAGFFAITPADAVEYSAYPPLADKPNTSSPSAKPSAREVSTVPDTSAHKTHPGSPEPLLAGIRTHALRLVASFRFHSLVLGVLGSR